MGQNWNFGSNPLKASLKPFSKLNSKPFQNCKLTPTIKNIDGPFQFQKLPSRFSLKNYNLTLKSYCNWGPAISQIASKALAYITPQKSIENPKEMESGSGNGALAAGTEQAMYITLSLLHKQ